MVILLASICLTVCSDDVHNGGVDDRSKTTYTASSIQSTASDVSNNVYCNK